MTSFADSSRHTPPKERKPIRWGNIASFAIISGLIILLALVVAAPDADDACLVRCQGKQELKFYSCHRQSLLSRDDRVTRVKGVYYPSDTCILTDI